MRRLLPTLLALLLGGCFWQQPGAGPDRNAHNPFEDQITVATAPDLDEVWSAQLDEGPAGDPITSNAGVHVADTRSVYAYAPRTGADLWRYDVTAPFAMQQPLARDDQVIVNRWDPTVILDDVPPDPVVEDAALLLDAATGAVDSQLAAATAVAWRGPNVLLWDVAFTRLGRPGFPFWSQNLRVRDTTAGTDVCCAALYGLGNANNQTPPQPAPNLTLGSSDVLQSGYGINNLADPTTGLGNGVRGYSIATSTPCTGGFELYLCPNWAIPLPGTVTTAPVLNDDETVAYVGTDSGRVAAIDLTTHTILWERQAGSAVTAPPALANGRLYLPLASGDLTVIDAADGIILGGYALGSSIDVQPAVAGEVVYVGTADGTVAAFDAGCFGGAPCPALWSDATGSAISGAPAVSSGRLYVGTADGRLIAYGL